MSVVGSDYDELKQYNLAEIYDPTPKVKPETSNGAAAKTEDNPTSDVAAKRSGLKDDVIPMGRSQDDKTSLDPQMAANTAHFTSS